MIETKEWHSAHKAMKATISKGVFDPCDFTSEELQTIQEVFFEYLMYIWLDLGDTRCNREGYTTASVAISNYFDKRKEWQDAR